MQLLLIAPSNEDSTFIKPLWAAILAAHTPSSFSVTFRDDSLEPIDLASESLQADLVGISVNSKTASRAYELGDAFRARGISVVMGGIHASSLPEEALKHADSVVRGEAEGQWPQVLTDFAAGALARIYSQSELPSLEGLPKPRRDIFRSVRYVPFDVVQTTRGCPFSCEFCSVSTYNGRQFRLRPVKEVLDELESCSPRILFADDNVMIHRAHSRELFTGLASLKKTWVGQASVASLEHDETLTLMARSGCKALFIGFESVSESGIASARKSQNHPKKYVELVRRLSDHGIAVWGSFVFGLDGDGVDSFKRTVEVCIEAKLTMALFALLTPYPSTRLYERLAEEGRLTHPEWWLNPADRPIYFRPQNMSVEQLHAGWVEAWQSMYSLSAIARRYDFGLDHTWVQNLAYWPINLLMRELANRKIAGGDRHYRKHRSLDVPFGF